MVHELGHSLGLQHTLTSSVMSTQPTSAVTKAAPLAADDIAGISLLYPAASYAGTTGSITGSVQLGGAGVNMASVVALSVNGTAVSGITNPDGTSHRRNSGGRVLRVRASAAAAGDGRSISRQHVSAAGSERISIPG
jgi:hypothetical protein